MTEKFDEDFGFSLVDDDFMPPKASEKLKEAESYEERFQQLQFTILTFVDKLSSDPDKTTIYWPNRVEKMKEFRDRILKI